MAEVNIRVAEPEDAKDILNLLRQLETESDTFLVDADLSQITAEMEAHQIELINQTRTNFLGVAEYDGQLIGIVTVDEVDQNGEVGIAVLNEFQQNGIATALLDMSIDWAENYSQLTELILSVYVDNIAAVKLYRNFNFEVIATVSAKRAQYQMKRQLKKA
ncbi:GNAT family acetyltransferase [Lentilactobacillus senioris DSM 24302 = JCM 17472]|uniref:GNAT family acetyltransferase n=1 Tax=Lentilactobacillus senioris DSM 24302 = JCM 17472 TaxID=1423802 RepID=A0A0R2D1K7_9LACO|nr:GNAT family N-acetyltransferase [Lentilactobacillus senioris]KRM93491.1 GNAT family acetyltransferase [Lentilactobacillus senioris DSM 24302 = JCM 17472]